MELFVPVIIAIVVASGLFFLIVRFQPSIMKFLKVSAKAEETAERLVTLNVNSILTVEEELRKRPQLNEHFDSFSEDEKKRLALMPLMERFAYYTKLESELNAKGIEASFERQKKEDDNPSVTEEMFDKYEEAGQLDDAVTELILRAKRELSSDHEALERRIAMIHHLSTKVRMKRGL